MASNVTAARCFDFTVDHHAGTVKAFHNRGGSGLKDVFLLGGEGGGGIMKTWSL